MTETESLPPTLMQRFTRWLGEGSPEPEVSARTLRWKLFLTAFCVLFFEMICIRWIPAHVRFLSYFMNFMLLASFLGIGVGILAGRAKRSWPFSFPVMVLLVAFVVMHNQFELRLTSQDVMYFAAGDEGSTLWNYMALPLIFMLVALAFVPLASPLARYFSSLPPLQAYAIDIAGGLLGVGVFFVMSWLSLPPLAWFGALLLAFAPMIARRKQPMYWVVSGLTLAIVYTMSTSALWSPYYRITTAPNAVGGHLIVANNTGHQETMLLQFKENFYYRPYDLVGRRKFKKVLVLGAGSGSDVALALAHGAERVDGVEIDPLIYQLGHGLNPHKPYADPRAHVVVDDARAFLRKNKEKYDLVIFALPDSLTLTSGFSSLRLESFLFTQEGLRSAREHVNDDGLMVLYNYYRQDWLVKKLAGMVASAWDGEPPFVTTYGLSGHAAVLMSGPRLKELPAGLDHPYSTEGKTIAGRGRPFPIIGEGRLSGDPNQKLATDDWPFVYMPVPTLPVVYVAALGVVGLIALLLVGAVSPRASRWRLDWHFFFLGAAFMLLETRSLVTFSLLFGSTWLVNSLVFFAILLGVLVAIGLNARWKFKRPWPLYLALVAAMVANFVVPMSSLLSIEDVTLRYGLASALTFLPILLANVVFSRSFKGAGGESGEPDVAFASNMLGALAGGMAEYVALVTGYQALLVIGLGFYVLAFVTTKRGEAAPAAVPSAAA